MKELTLEELVSYCKNYGFVFQGSEIYGGLANSWDFGPLGVLLKNNIKSLWTQRMVQEDIITLLNGCDGFINTMDKVLEYDSKYNNNNSNNNNTNNAQKIHKVVKGDSLWAIAQKHYGKGSLYPKIKEANKSKYPSLAKSNVIYTNMELIIP